MNRELGITLAALLTIGLTSAGSATAQEFIFPGAMIDEETLGVAVPGAFGANYTQPPPVTGIPGNRWDMLAGPSYVEGMSYAVATTEANPFEANEDAANVNVPAPRPRRRNGNAAADAPPPPFLAPLPVTRLYGDGGFMPSAYAPFTRQQTYGAGYGLGPYGSNYYSNFWHGRPINP